MVWHNYPRRMALDIATFLLAISMVESGINDQAVGHSGELGRYQIKRIVWRQHAPSTWKFYQAKTPSRAGYVARRHVEWIIERSKKDNPTHVALVWKCGLSKVNRRQFGGDDCHYAGRVARIYYDLKADSK